jgi:hypothetical protein
METTGAADPVGDKPHSGDPNSPGLAQHQSLDRGRSSEASSDWTLAETI